MICEHCGTEYEETGNFNHQLTNPWACRDALKQQRDKARAERDEWKATRASRASLFSPHAVGRGLGRKPRLKRGEEEMGISWYVDGIRPPDATWRKMKAVLEACREAKIAEPKEVREFFKGETPDEKGVLINLGLMYEKPKTPGVERYEGEESSGFEVDLDKLREHDPTIKILRFYVSS